MTSRATLVVAAWLGLATGLIEGAGLWLLQARNWLAPDRLAATAAPEMIWGVALFDLLCFCAAGGCLGVALAVTTPTWLAKIVARLAVGAPAFLCCFVVLSLSGHLGWRRSLLVAAMVTIGWTVWFGRNEVRVLRFSGATLPWLGLIALVAAAGGVGAPWLLERAAVASLPTAPPGAPNIVLITVDSLRPDRLAALGRAHPLMPTLDRLAREGVLFTMALAPTPLAGPSMASMLTGRYPYEHGDHGWGNPGLAGFPTVAQRLREIGYRTAAFSADTQQFARYRGLDAGFVHFEDAFSAIRVVLTNTAVGRRLGGLAHRLGFQTLWLLRPPASDVTRAVLRWVDRERRRPFLAVVSYIDAKTPYTRPEDNHPLRRTETPGERMYRLLAHRYSEVGPELSPGEIQQAIDTYDQALAGLDRSIGTLLDGMHPQRDAKTLVVVAGTYGEAFGDGGRFFHGTSVDLAQTHTPLVFWWPGRVPRETRIDYPVSLVAVPGTLLELAGAGDAARSTFRGPSLATAWGEVPAAPRDESCLVAELFKRPRDGPAFPAYHRDTKALLCGDWFYVLHRQYEEKFVREDRGTGGIRWLKVVYPQGAEELYDWRRDPQGRDNRLAAPEAQPALLKLRQRMGEITAAARP